MTCECVWVWYGLVVDSVDRFVLLFSLSGTNITFRRVVLYSRVDSADDSYRQGQHQPGRSRGSKCFLKEF